MSYGNSNYKGVYPSAYNGVFGVSNVGCWSLNYDDAGYVDIPVWEAAAGDSIVFTMEFTGSNGDYQYIFDGSGSPRAYLAANGANWGFSSTQMDVTVDGLDVSSGDAIPVGVTFDVSIIFKTAGRIDKIGRYNSSDQQYFSGMLRTILMRSPTDVRNYEALISGIRPSTLVLEDSSGGQNGTLVNFPVGNEWKPVTCPTTRCWIPHFGATTASIVIPLWVSGNGSGTVSFEVNFLRDNGNRYQLCMSHTAASQGWIGLERGVFQWDPRYDEVYIDGVLTASGTKSVVYNQEYTIVAKDTTNAIGIGELGNGYTGGGSTWYLEGGLRHVSFSDSADPTLNRYYPGTVSSIYRPNSSEPYIDTSNNAAHGVLSGFQPPVWEETECRGPIAREYDLAYTEEY